MNFEISTGRLRKDPTQVPYNENESQNTIGPGSI